MLHGRRVRGGVPKARGGAPQNAALYAQDQWHGGALQRTHSVRGARDHGCQPWRSRDPAGGLQPGLQCSTPAGPEGPIPGVGRPRTPWSCARARQSTLQAAQRPCRLAQSPPGDRKSQGPLASRQDPVKATLLTSGCPASAAPAVSPNPAMMLTTPSGRPASSSSSPRRSAESGVSSATLSTTVQPVVSAGASFQAAISSGKFQGMICPTTPTGSRRVAEKKSEPGAASAEIGIVLPSSFVAQPDM